MPSDILGGRAALAGIDARAKLAGTNKMELLLFRVGSPETYGINVFKVREVIRAAEITQAPQQPAHVVGMASLRGQLVPVVDLIAVCGNPAPAAGAPLMIVTEFSESTQAFLVEAVETIVRIDWSDVHQPPNMLANRSKLTGVTRLTDGRLASILDVEQILHGITGKKELVDLPYLAAQRPVQRDIRIFFADDSSFARGQLQQILDSIGVKSEYAINGREAWERLDALAALAAAGKHRLADTLPIIITDIEMPEMDGFMLTRMLKADRRFEGVKVLLHSSMSEASNRDKGFAMGADGFLSKYNPTEVAESLRSCLGDLGKLG